MNSKRLGVIATAYTQSTTTKASEDILHSHCNKDATYKDTTHSAAKKILFIESLDTLSLETLGT